MRLVSTTTTPATLDLPGIQQWLWDAACQLRGALDAPKYKDFILPLIFLKRLSDVFDDELAELAREYGSRAVAEQLVREDPEQVRFYFPEEACWGEIAKQTVGVGEYLTDVVRLIARRNPVLQGVVDAVDFNATSQGQRLLDDGALHNLIQVLGQHRLGLEDVDPDLLGRAYEYLLRKFAEGQGQSAGEFFTPPEIATLMARILAPAPGDTIYDPACGSAGLLMLAGQCLGVPSEPHLSGSELSGGGSCPPASGDFRPRPKLGRVRIGVRSLA